MGKFTAKNKKNIENYLEVHHSLFAVTLTISTVLGIPQCHLILVKLLWFSYKTQISEFKN